MQVRGMRLAGWIANVIDPAMARREENLQTLQRRIAAPLLGVVNHSTKPDVVRAARSLDISRINVVI
jgi:dethiobiotin synthetase